MYLRCGTHEVAVNKLTFQNGMLFTEKDDLYDLGFKVGDVVEVVEGPCPDRKAKRREAMIAWIATHERASLIEMAEQFKVSKGTIIVELFMGLTASELALLKSGGLTIGRAYLLSRTTF